jgi:hypothetical protein
VMFGVTHICAVDGYSCMIVGFVTMPIKNNVEIFAHLYRYMYRPLRPANDIHNNLYRIYDGVQY